MAKTKKSIEMNEYLSDSSKELFDKVYPTIEKNFPNHSNSHQQDIRKYIDKNNEILFASGPTYRLYFTDDERDKIFPHIGMRKNQIDEIIKNDKRVESSWYFMRSFYLSIVLIIRYYMKNKMQKQMENSVLYMALSLYSAKYGIFFQYPPNEQIMEYTINNLSNKYKLKQTGTLIASIKDTALTCHNTYEEYLEIGTDVLLNTYIMHMHTRITGFLKQIASEYYKNWQEGNFINTEEDDYSEENYHINDSNSFVISRITDAVTNKIITKGVDYKLAKLSANLCGVSVSGLQKSLSDIVNNKDREIKVLVNLILQLYLSDSRNSVQSIGSKKFIETCLEYYVKSNTNDKNIIEIKDILDKWLTECSTTYVKTNRIATKNNLRKACYMYIAFSIQQESIRM